MWYKIYVAQQPYAVKVITSTCLRSGYEMKHLRNFFSALDEGVNSLIEMLHGIPKLNREKIERRSKILKILFMPFFVAVITALFNAAIDPVKLPMKAFCLADYTKELLFWSAVYLIGNTFFSKSLSCLDKAYGRIAFIRR